MSEVRDRTSEPPGALSRNTQYFVMGGIALLVLVASLFSGRSVPKVADFKGGSVATATRPELLRQVEQSLKRERQEAAERLRREEELRRLQAAHETQSQPPRTGAYQERDFRDDEERRRQLRAPFTPSLVVVAKDAEKELPPTEIPAQVVFRADEQPQTAAAKTDFEANTGSGKFLPDREGALFRIYQGTLVRTVLTNRLDGTFTGPVKCIVTEPIVSKDKTAVLIPKGSLFLGEARRAEERNQKRLAVWFERLLLPNGYSIQLEKTPGLNSAGETGLKDRTNNHYLQRFSLAGAIGLLGGLRLYGGRPEPYGFESGVISSLGSTASSDLSRRMNDIPTITIREGHVVNVYLSDDLLFPEYREEKGQR